MPGRPFGIHKKKERKPLPLDQMCHWYNAYEMKPSKRKGRMREDIYVQG